MSTIAQIDWNFQYHKPTEEKIYTHQTIRNMLHQVVCNLNELVPDSREKSLALTKLEEAMFWANAAVARNPRPEDET